MNKIIASTIELNVSKVSKEFAERLKQVGESKGFDTFYHGKDRLIFVLSQDFDRRIPEIKDLETALKSTCSDCGVAYYDLLDL